jgi:sugar lactone lactonase YvrE
VWVLDAGNGQPGTGGLLVVAEADGRIYRIPLTRDGQPFTPDGALDVVLAPGEGHLYIADTERHWVFRLPKPAIGPQATPTAIERVAGRPPANPEAYVYVGTPGFVDATARPYPSIYDVSSAEPDFTAEPPTPQAVTTLLNRPGSLCFDAAGDLLIADTGNGRIKLKRGAALYTIAGGLDTRYLTGDARLAFLPATGYMSRDSAGNVLVADKREAVVRRLHTARGSL